MKMRKIIAVVAAALMLCTIIPMGAISVAAAPGDVVLDRNFDDDNGGFARADAEDGYIVFDATTADWQNTYTYVNGIKANTNYRVTFKAKANKEATLAFKISNNWAGYTVNEAVNVTTEWQDYELNINSGALTDVAIVMFASDYPAVDAPVYCIDDLKIVEPVDPALIGKVVNGDFSSSEGWTLGNGASIADGYLTLNNPGLWAEAALQSVPAKANTNYEITWKSQRVSGSGAFNLIVLDSANADLTPVEGQNWMNETSGNWVENSYSINTGSSEVIKLKFSTEAVNSGEIRIDDVKISEIKDPSYDGYITNGDFETGKGTPWNLLQQSAISAEAAHSGDYGLLLQGDGASWGGTGDQAFSVEIGKTYVVQTYVKAVSQGVNIQIQNPIGTTVAGQYMDTSKAADWTLITLEFTATATDVRFNTCCSGILGTDKVYIDDVFVFEKKAASNDGYIVNGDFETGTMDGLSPYQQTCVSRDAAKDGNFGLKMMGDGSWGGVGLWTINGLEAGATYKFEMDMNAIEQGFNWTLWQDSTSSGIEYAKGYFSTNAWTHIEEEFVADSSVAVLNINGGGTGNAETVYLDNLKITLVKAAACEHEYKYDCDKVCSKCGEETRPEAQHEYMYPCDAHCMICYELTNEDAAHNTSKVDAVEATCEKAGNVAYWTCEYCGYAWLDEACTIVANRFSIIVPATGVHTYDDEYDADCNVCGDVREVPEKPVDIVYGDADGDGEVTLLDASLLQQYLTGWDVTLDEAAADADGDGEVTLLDASLLQQYLTGWDVTLGA